MQFDSKFKIADLIHISSEPLIYRNKPKEILMPSKIKPFLFSVCNKTYLLILLQILEKYLTYLGI